MNEKSKICPLAVDWWARAAMTGLLLAALAGCAGTPERTGASKADWSQYAVKFVCGEPEPARMLLNRGRYFTAVNIHNPDLKHPREFWLKVAVAEPVVLDKPSELSAPISGFRRVVLAADEAREVDCPNIHNMLGAPPGPPFRKGFVVILSRVELDVVGVYTAGREAGGVDEVQSIHIEPVPPRAAGDPREAVAPGDPNACSGEGCCCNSPRTTSGSGAWWPDCASDFECVSKQPGGVITPAGIVDVNVCRRRGTLATPDIASRQPRFCRTDL